MEHQARGGFPAHVGQVQPFVQADDRRNIQCCKVLPAKRASSARMLLPSAGAQTEAQIPHMAVLAVKSNTKRSSTTIAEAKASLHFAPGAPPAHCKAGLCRRCAMSPRTGCSTSTPAFPRTERRVWTASAFGSVALISTTSYRHTESGASKCTEDLRAARWTAELSSSSAPAAALQASTRSGATTWR